MNALEGIAKAVNFLRERGVVPEKVLLHPTFTTRNYVFIVEKDAKLYVIANSKDVDLAASLLIMNEASEDLTDYVHGVRLSESESEFISVNGGYYVWTLPLQ